MGLSKEEIIEGILKVEGGYVNNPFDKGGPTNFGITYQTAKENILFLTPLGWDGKSMKTFTKEMAFVIYKKRYWDSLKLDDVYSFSPELASKLFDIGVNCGSYKAGLWFQTLLNVLNREQKDYKDIEEDGVIGKNTIATFINLTAVRGVEKACAMILMGLICMQGNHYISICKSRPANENFIAGWLSRMNHNLDEYVLAVKK